MDVQNAIMHINLIVFFLGFSILLSYLSFAHLNFGNHPISYLSELKLILVEKKAKGLKANASKNIQLY